MPSMKGRNNPAYKHGYATHSNRPSIYHRWQHMIGRCHHPKDKDYPRYGAVGITVCERWRVGEGALTGFECWLHDMGLPFSGAIIDRVDGTKGYTPENCRWVTVIESNNNRKSNRFITARGQTMSIAQWARALGMSRQVIRYRLEQGADAEEALFKPVNRGVKINLNKE